MDRFDKSALRESFLKKRKGLTIPEVIKKSQDVALKFFELAEIKGENHFAAYLPINNEVDTKGIIDDLLQKEVSTFVPAYLATNNDYLFTRFDGWQNLEEGPKGILQPRIIKSVDSSLIEVAILPGLAFSKSGVRLGYGKGVFDRLLAKSKAIRIGLAYDFQLVDKIEKEKHDLLMDMVVTEKKVYRMKKNDKIHGHCRIV